MGPRFIAQRVALTMGFTAFLHGPVSKILPFRLRLSDPMLREMGVDVLPIRRVNRSQSRLGNILQGLGRNLMR